MISKTKSNKDRLLGIIYRSNTGQRADFAIFSSNLHDLMDVINNGRRMYIVTGYLNIHLFIFGIHEKTNGYINVIFSNGYMAIILQPIRLPFSSATLINHIYTNDILSKSTSDIAVTDVVDHSVAFLVVSDKSADSPPTSELKRILSQFHTFPAQTKFTINSFLYIKMVLTQR